MVYYCCEIVTQTPEKIKIKTFIGPWQAVKLHRSVWQYPQKYSVPLSALQNFIAIFFGTQFRATKSIADLDKIN